MVKGINDSFSFLLFTPAAKRGCSCKSFLSGRGQLKVKGHLSRTYYVYKFSDCVKKTLENDID